jgi:chromosome segregation ATPase
MEEQQPQPPSKQDSSSGPDFADILNKISSIKDLIAASSASHKKSIKQIFDECQTEIAAIIELIRQIDEAINELLKTNASSAEDKQKLQAKINRMNNYKNDIMKNLEELTNFQGAQSGEVDKAITDIEALPGKITDLKKEAQKLLDNINRTSGQASNSQGTGPTVGGRKSRRLRKKGKGKGKKSVKRGGAKKAKKSVRRTHKGGFVWGLGKKKTGKKEKKLKKPKSRKGLF